MHLRRTDPKSTSDLRTCGPSLVVSTGDLTHNFSETGYLVLFLFSKSWNLLGESHSTSPGLPCLSFVPEHLIIWHDSEPEGKEDCKWQTREPSWALQLHGCRSCIDRDWDAQHHCKCKPLGSENLYTWNGQVQKQIPKKLGGSPHQNSALAWPGCFQLHK